MRLQLRTSYTERCSEIHLPHGRIWLEDYFDVVIEVHREIDLTGVAMGPTAHISKIGVAFCCAAA
jgi:hypothetical protein